jgi:hypothetical protein
LVGLAVLLAVVPAPASAQEPVRARDTLFSVDTPLQVTLRADWRTVFRNRNPEEEFKHPGGSAEEAASHEQADIRTASG